MRKFSALFVLIVLLSGFAMGARIPFVDSGVLKSYDFENGNVANHGVNASLVGGVGDIDSDGNPEIVYSTTGNYLKAFDVFSSTVQDIGPGGESVDAISGVNDTDGDNVPEVAYLDSTIRIHDPADGTTSDTGTSVYQSALGDMKELDGDGNPDIAFTEPDNQRLNVYDTGSGTVTDEAVNTPQGVGGIGDIDNNGNPDIAVVQSGSLKYFEYGPDTVTDLNTAVDSDGARAIVDVGSDSDKDVVFIDSGVLKYYDTGSGGTTNIGQSVDAQGVGFSLYTVPAPDADINTTTNRTDYDNSIRKGQPIELVSSVQTRAGVQEVKLATRPDSSGSYTNWTGGTYDSPAGFSGETSRVYANFTYSNSSLDFGTRVYWKVWVKDNTGKWTVSGEDNETTAFDIEPTPLELFESSPDQQKTYLSLPVPFQENPYVSNPTQHSFVNQSLTASLIDTVNSGSIELTGPEGEAVPFTFNSSSDEINFTVDSIEAGEQIPYTVEYNVDKLNVDRGNFNTTSSQGDQLRVQVNITNPNPVSLENVKSSIDYPYPRSQVESDLFRVSGTSREDIDQNPDFGVERIDTDLNGLVDRVNWTIPSIGASNGSDDNESYELVSRLGEPVVQYREDVITNKPVREVKPVRWRVGFAFQNDNPFTVNVNRKVRVPQGADSFRFNGNPVQPNFDLLGRYIPFNKVIPANSNTTHFLRFTTRSVATSVDPNPPNQFIAGQDAKGTIKIRFENLADKDLENVTKLVQLEYGENVSVTDLDTGSVIENRSVVDSGFDVDIGNLDDNQVRSMEVYYEVPTADVEHVVNRTSDKGNNLTLWRVDSAARRPIQNMKFRTSAVDCTEVENVVAYGTNSSDNVSIDDWECGQPLGSTLVPLGYFGSNTEVNLGIEYREKDPIVNVAALGLPQLVAFLKWIFWGFVAIVLFETGRRIFNKGV